MAKGNTVLLKKPLAESVVSSLDSMIERRKDALSGKKKKTIRMLRGIIRTCIDNHAETKGNVVYIKIPRTEFEMAKNLAAI